MKPRYLQSEVGRICKGKHADTLRLSKALRDNFSYMCTITHLKTLLPHLPELTVHDETCASLVQPLGHLSDNT
jgi:hypothetical protein